MKLSSKSTVPVVLNSRLFNMNQASREPRVKSARTARSQTRAFDQNLVFSLESMIFLRLLAPRPYVALSSDVCRRFRLLNCSSVACGVNGRIRSRRVRRTRATIPVTSILFEVLLLDPGQNPYQCALHPYSSDKSEEHHFHFRSHEKEVPTRSPNLALERRSICHLTRLESPKRESVQNQQSAASPGHAFIRTDFSSIFAAIDFVSFCFTNSEPWREHKLLTSDHLSRVRTAVFPKSKPDSDLPDRIPSADYTRRMPSSIAAKNGGFNPDTFLATIGEGRKILTVLKKQAIFVQGDEAETPFMFKKEG